MTACDTQVPATFDEGDRDRGGGVLGPARRDRARQVAAHEGKPQDVAAWPHGASDELAAAPRHPIPNHPPGAIKHSTLESVEWWYDVHGTPRRIDDMASNHLAACIGMLEARAREFWQAEVLLRSLEQLQGWEITTMPNPRQISDPLAWLRATPLLIAMRVELVARAAEEPGER